MAISLNLSSFWLKMVQMLMLKICLGGQVYIMPYHKNIRMVKILVNEDTNLELRSFEFGTPLLHALFDGEHEIFELLISFGANVSS